MSNKSRAIEFLTLVAEQKIKEAYEKLIDEDFIHHNQYFKGDRNSLMTAMEESAIKNPNKALEVKHSYEDGPFVITHSFIKQHVDDLGAAVVHIFKFREDKVIEFWDLGQQLIKDSPNKNGPF